MGGDLAVLSVQLSMQLSLLLTGCRREQRGELS